MSGTSKISTRVSIRLPNSIVRTLERRIAGRLSRWSTVGEYLKERIIYDVERSHSRGKNPKSTIKEMNEHRIAENMEDYWNNQNGGNETT